MTNAITIEHVNKVYDGKVTALKDVSFNVEEGEVFGLVGPDGAGKSTLFNILTTLLLPDSGKISLLGMDVINEYKSVRQIIGYLPGVFSLYPDLSSLSGPSGSRFRPSATARRASSPAV